jgi:TatD DNase family protein
MMTKNSQPKFFDTHCHLHEEIFDVDRDEIIAKMKAVGVEKFLTIGTSPKDCERALKLRDQYPDMCRVALAIDPTSSQKYLGKINEAEKDFEKIAKLARENEVSAIGETGLDRYWRLSPLSERDGRKESKETIRPERGGKASSESDDQFVPETLEIQHLLFGRHIDLATELKLPLVIHQREALSLTLNTLKEKKFVGTTEKKAGVFHSFTGDIKDAKRITEIGFYIGINGIVTFKNASKLQGAVKNLAAGDILYETDAPFLTPEPHRGERNDPTQIPVIAEFIDSLQEKQISEEVYKNSLNFIS